MDNPGKVLGPNQIKAILPVRYPLLMIDRAAFISENELVGLRNLTVNELFFQGHFPDHPILPGVLQIEAMRQLACLAVIPKLDPKGTHDVYMRVLERVKFRKPNLPGDRMKISAKIVELTDDGAVAECCVHNNSGLTCEAKITLAVRPRTQPDKMPELFNDVDKSENSVLDISGVMKFMPHRYPFLFADYIAKREGDLLQTVKLISSGEEFFNGCPDDYKTMPEALLCEVMAQAGCACILSTPENANKLGYFMSIDKAEFFAPVFPGDQLVADVILPPSRSRFGKSSGEARVDGKVIMRITLMFAIVDK